MRHLSSVAWQLAAALVLMSGACKSENTALQSRDHLDAAPEASAAIVPADVAVSPDPPPDVAAPPDGPSGPDVAGSRDGSAVTADVAMLRDGPAATADVAVLRDGSAVTADAMLPPVADTAALRDGPTPAPDNAAGETASPPGEAGPSRAALCVDKSTVNLGTLDPMETGVATLTVTNCGSEASGVLSITVSAGMTATGCSGALAGLASCTLTVTATPSSAGPFGGSISITASPGATTPLLITVISMVAAGPGFSVQPATIDLGNIVVGQPATRAITVTAEYAISDLAVSASGAELTLDKAASTCTSVLATGASCTVVVRFTATTAGSKSDAAVISGGGANGKVVSVPITAVAQTPARLVITPSTLQVFAAVVSATSSPISFGVANAGDVATGALSAVLTGANAADFTVTSSCLLLAPLAACSVSVTFKPAIASAADEKATLTVVDSGPGGSSVSVALSGTVYVGSDPVITSTTSDLGSVTVGATGPAIVFGLTNSGDTATGPLTVAVSSTEFIVTNDTCAGASIAPGGGCTVAIALRPATVGVKAATLTITGPSGSPAVKLLTGTGLAQL